MAQVDFIGSLPEGMGSIEQVLRWQFELSDKIDVVVHGELTRAAGYVVEPLRALERLDVLEKVKGGDWGDARVFTERPVYRLRKARHFVQSA